MLGPGDLPSLFQAADAASLSGQRSTARLRLLQLGLLVVAALGAEMTWETGGGIRPAVLVGGAAFAFVLMVDYLLATAGVHEQWYRGRAGAESAKTLAWKYAVGGDPFSVDLPEPESEEAFLDQLQDTFRGLSALVLPDAATVSAQISPAMKALRAAPLAERMAAYRRGRLDDQAAWYTRHAERHRRQSTIWSWVGAAASLLGVTAALARGFGYLDFNLGGVAAAAAAAVVAWSEFRQHRILATSYPVAVQDLAFALARVEHVATERQWAEFVRDAEEAISREHTTWLARRGALGTAGEL